ncbi:hypothetical protein ACFCT7_02915 [Fulvivirgaceae bacterium LMO-SS25]
MKTNKKINLGILLVLLMGWGLASCDKNDDADYEVPEDLKRFRPATITASNGETQAILTWPRSLFTEPGEVTYTLELATDSLFAESVMELETPANELIVTDSEIAIKLNHYARVKANGLTPALDSEWVRSDSFMITGEQIFFPILDADILPSSVLLKWRPTATPTRIVLNDGFNSIEVQLSDNDRAEAQRIVDGLEPLTAYVAEIFQGNVSKGTTSFTTKEKSIFDIVLTPADDFRSIVEAAEDGAIIGLEPGEYHILDSEGEYASLRLEGKTIDLRSTSLDPTNTKVVFREFTFTESGAGISMTGITFTASESNGDYFWNFAGGEAQFTDVILDNCIVEGMRVTFMRANRASNNAHKINNIIVKNSWIRNNKDNNYHVFHLDKLEFRHLEVTNTTFNNNTARAFVGWTTNLTMPFVPTVRIDQVTINGLGNRGRNDVLLDANNNEIDFEMTNSIINNIPMPGTTVGSRLIRANNSNARVMLANCNLFNLTTGGAEPEPLSIYEYVILMNNLAVDLGWTAEQSDLTLPAGSPLRNASSIGGPIGDLRWAF